MGKSEIVIKTYIVNLVMGKGWDLTFLTTKELDDLDLIGYSGKLVGKSLNLEDYLNSLNKGEFKIHKLKSDPTEFTETLLLIRAQKLSLS